MRFVCFVFILSLSLQAQWPKPEQVKIIIPVQASVVEKKLANEMAVF